MSSLEIDRRMVAFSDLLVAVYVGLISASLLWAYNSLALVLPLLFWGTVAYLIMGFLVHLAMARFFTQYSGTKLSLTGKYFERATMRSKERIYYRDITDLKVLWTTRKLVRDIEIRTKNGSTIVIDGVDKFEELKKELENRSGIVAEESRELADFDHELFYPILGIILGIGSMIFLSFLTILNEDQIKTANKLFSGYLFVLGLYFIMARPFVKRYGKKLQKHDYIYATISIMVSYIMLKLL